MKLTELEMTCGACPSQWEGKTEDGRFLYGRFRWGYLEVAAAPTLDQAVRAAHDDPEVEILFSGQVSDGMDGMMSTEEMLAYARILVGPFESYCTTCMDIMPHDHSCF